MRNQTAQALARLHEVKPRLAAHVHVATPPRAPEPAPVIWAPADRVCAACHVVMVVRLVVELDGQEVRLCAGCWNAWVQGAIEVRP